MTDEDQAAVNFDDAEVAPVPWINLIYFIVACGVGSVPFWVDGDYKLAVFLIVVAVLVSFVGRVLPRFVTLAPGGRNQTEIGLDYLLSFPARMVDVLGRKFVGALIILVFLMPIILSL